MYFGPNLPSEALEEEAKEQVPCTFMRTLTGHEGPVLAVRFNGQGSHCISCGKVRSVWRQ